MHTFTGIVIGIVIGLVAGLIWGGKIDALSKAEEIKLKADLQKSKDKLKSKL